MSGDNEIKMSITTFDDGYFEIGIKDNAEEIVFSGRQPKLTDAQLDLVHRLAPPCVWSAVKNCSD